MTRVPDALAKDLAWEAELGRVLRSLATSGVETLLLKGAAYRGREYALGERPAEDADLLVRPRDFRRAAAALRTCGYTVHLRAEAQAERPGPFPFRIDLHERLYPGSDAGLWERSEPVLVAGAAGQRLSAPDAFAYALWHGAIRHAAVSERLLEDLHRIARGGKKDFWVGALAEIRLRGLVPAAAEVLPLLVGRGVRIPRTRLNGKAWMRWGLRRGPRGGTGHLLMALSSPDPWRAAGRLARSARNRICRGK